MGPIRRGCTGLLVLAALLAASCGDPYRRQLKDTFPSTIGVDAGANAERNLHGALGTYHLSAGDVDCMIDGIRRAGRLDPSTAVEQVDGIRRLVFTPEDLNGFAHACDVDISKLWYMTD